MLPRLYLPNAVYLHLNPWSLRGWCIKWGLWYSLTQRAACRTQMTQWIPGPWSHSWGSAIACITYFSGCCDQTLDKINLSQKRFALGHGLRGSSLSQQGRRNSQSCGGGACGAACSHLRKQSTWAGSVARLQCSKLLTPQPTSPSSLLSSV